MVSRGLRGRPGGLVGASGEAGVTRARTGQAWEREPLGKRRPCFSPRARVLRGAPGRAREAGNPAPGTRFPPWRSGGQARRGSPCQAPGMAGRASGCGCRVSPAGGRPRRATAPSGVWQYGLGASARQGRRVVGTPLGGEVPGAERRRPLGGATPRPWSALAMARSTPALLGRFSLGGVISLSAGRNESRRCARATVVSASRRDLRRYS